jgi:hypothetical protein
MRWPSGTRRGVPMAFCGGAGTWGTLPIGQVRPMSVGGLEADARPSPGLSPIRIPAFRSGASRRGAALGRRGRRRWPGERAGGPRILLASAHHERGAGRDTSSYASSRQAETARRGKGPAGTTRHAPLRSRNRQTPRRSSPWGPRYGPRSCSPPPRGGSEAAPPRPERSAACPAATEARGGRPALPFTFT